MLLSSLAGRKVVVVGWNTSAVELVRYLLNQKAQVTLFDARDVEWVRTQVAQSGLDATLFSIEATELTQKTRTEAECVIVTPDNFVPAEVLADFEARQVRVMSELEMVSELIQVPYITITGSNGKTTTTMLLSEMLKAQGRRVANNVDRPLSALLNENNQVEMVVVRAEALQLSYIQNFRSSMTALLNVYPERPQLFSSIESISGCYQRVFKNSDANSLSIINASDARIALFCANIPGKKYYFSTKELPEIWEGSWVSKTHLNVRLNVGQPPLTFNLANLRLRGDHNKENLMAATLMALNLGVSQDNIFHVIENFRSPRFRVQFVKRYNSVAFYNDSACGNVDGLVRTLHSFQEPILLIAGGRDFGADFAPLAPHVRQKVKNLILVGEAKEKINRVLGDFTETFLVGTMEEAAMLAYQKSRSGDVVLFSPACDYSDAFASYQAKGEYFESLIDQMTRQRSRNVFY